jgi:cobalamin biosynthesis protein CbiG
MALGVVIGIGVTGEAPARGAVKLVDRLLSGPLADARPLAIATIFGRAEHRAVQAVSGFLGVPILVFDAARLEQETPRLLNPSASLFERIGCHGVAEAAALAAAGPDARLLVGKTVEAGVTVAIAGAGGNS